VRSPERERLFSLNPVLIITHKNELKEMKKNEYIVPEMEVLELKYNFSLLAGSSDEEPTWSDIPGDPDDPGDAPD
jgi:hypothetical protein